MANFQDFLNQYNGQSGVGDTTENKGQCVGLVSVWIDALNLPHIWGNAYELFANADEKFFNKILNTPEAVPQTGDIVVWGKGFNNTLGHTGIATGTGDLKSFEAFEQNDPLGFNCHLKTYKYTWVSGWLRPIISQSTAIDPVIIQHADNWIALLQKYNFSDNKDLVFAEIDKLPTLEDAVRSKDQQLQDDKTKITELITQAEGLKKQLTGLTDDNQKLITQVAEQEKTITTTTQEVSRLSGELQSLQQATQVPVLTGWRKKLYDFIIWLVKQ